MDCKPCQPCHDTHRHIPPFWGFTEFTASIPKMYFDVESQEQRIHRICELINRLICYCGYLGDKGNEFAEELENLANEFEKFKESGFEDYYLAQIEQWVNEHMADIISQYVKQVFFGLTLDGYFVAYIPEGSAWEDIIFDTGQVYELDTYGRLMLYYETDSSSEVWQEQTLSDNIQTIVSRLDREITVINGEITDINEDVSNLGKRVTANETTKKESEVI